MRKHFQIMAAILIASLGCPANAMADADGDVSLGRAIFDNHCSNCHDNSKHVLNDAGPSLYRVVGRRVGSVPDYEYSPVLKQAYVHGDRWTVQRLDRFLRQPISMYGGTGMPMNFEKSSDRRAIIAYLRTLTDQKSIKPISR